MIKSLTAIIFGLVCLSRPCLSTPIYIKVCIFKNSNHQFKLIEDYKEPDHLTLEMDIDAQAAEFPIADKVMLKFADKYYKSVGVAKFMRSYDLDKLKGELQKSMGAPSDFNVVWVEDNDTEADKYVPVRCLAISTLEAQGEESFLLLI